MKRVLTYNDVALVPQFNNVNSRTEPNLETKLTNLLTVGMPLVPANMESVISPTLAGIITNYDSVPILHRFGDEKQIEKLIRDTLLQSKKENSRIIVSCGLGKTEEDIHSDGLKFVFRMINKYSEIVGICIDVAHGHDSRMLKTIELIKQRYPEISVIAGNVCTPQATYELINAGANAVKVNIGGGSACITRIVTGFGVSNFTAVQECAEVGKKFKIPIIADSGIEGSREVAIALAAGASTVMIGKLFAATFDSAAYQQNEEHGRMTAHYRGQASKEFQEEYFGGLKSGTVPEGKEILLDMTQTSEELIEELLGGLRSSMTYGGSRNIEEFQRKAEFVEVTSNYMIESNIRK